MIFLCTKKDGHFTIEKDFDIYCQQLSDGTYKIEFDEFKKTRTGQQNRYYWKYLRIIADETGDDPISLHELFKRWFLPPKFTYIKLIKKEIKLPDTTTNLSKQEFSEYISKIEEKTGIPAPDTEKYEN